VPQRQRVLVKESAQFERVDSLGEHRIHLHEIRERASELVLLVQGSTLRELAGAHCLRGARAFWSLWRGYLEQPSGRRVAALLGEQGVRLVQLHASGHARVEDLQALAAAMSPARVVPIHTAAPELFATHFDNVELHADGEWWSV
jgi:ribonuclease J